MSNIVLNTHASINEVSQQVWDSFVDNSRISIQYNHLKAIEESRMNDHIPRYVTIYDEDTSEYIGIAYYFIMDMDMSQASDDIKPEIITTVKQWYPNFLKMKMLECGLLAGLGQTFFIKNDRQYEILPLLIQEIEEEGMKEDVDFILYRDIESNSYNKNKDFFIETNYESFAGYPYAVMKHNLSSLPEYIKELRSKKRIQVNAILNKIEKPEITVQKTNDLKKYAKCLSKLWNEVHLNSDSYSHEILTPEYFISLGDNFGEKVDLFLLKRNNKPIAFILCFDSDDEYFLAFVGYSQKYNREYNLYFNMYYIAMNEAFNKGRKNFNMGITTYDVKIKLGCEMRNTMYFIKNLKNEKISHSLANFFSEIIEHPVSKHRVFSDNRQVVFPEDNDFKMEEQFHNDILKKTDDYHRINELRLLGCYSFFPAFESAQRTRVTYEGNQLYMLGSNSYLGLANDVRIKKAAHSAIDYYGTGCSGSPAMNGTLDLHKKLADTLKSFVKKEDCIIYSTGYQANLGAIGALATSSDMIIMDEFSHASLIDGALFSRAKIARYRHNDLEYLEKLLIRFSDVRKMVIADSVFSMEGTVVDLPNLVKICKKYNARLVLDEAHAIGVYGKNGGGVAEHFNLSDQIDIITGTFSKSCASVGGFVAGSHRVIDYLRHTSRSHVFSASLPPAAVATVLKALEIIISEPERREKVVENARYMANGLRGLGYEIQYHDTAIVPIFCRDEVITLTLFKKLIDMGVYVNPVLYPAVPKGGELLRTSYLATHTIDQLDAVLDVFDRLRTRYFPIYQDINISVNVA